MSSEETTRNLEVSTDYRTKEDLRLVLREVMESIVTESITPQFTIINDRLTALENRLVALETGQEELRRELKLTNSKMETLNRYILDAQGRILDVTDRMDAFERSSAA